MTHSWLLTTLCEYFGEFLQHFYVNCPTTCSIICISCSFKYSPPTCLLLKVCTHLLPRLFLNMFFMLVGTLVLLCVLCIKTASVGSYSTLRGDASVCLALISNKQAFPLMFVSARCSHWCCWYLLSECLQLISAVASVKLMKECKCVLM